MRIIKHGHSCVRLEDAGHALVVDPGMFADAAAVDGATAVLLTHEHPDHVDIGNLRATDAPVFTIAAVHAKLAAEAPDVAERVSVVAPGDALDIGVPVRVVGETHAEILPDLHFDNSGYLIEMGGLRILHPGDALTVPEPSVDLLCLPVSAPWLKASECVAFAEAVGAPRSLAIHDRVYSEFGLATVDGHIARILEAHGQSYVRLPEGAELD